MQKDKEQRCWACRAKGAGLLMCGRCKIAFFCDKECQRAGWKAHKFQCRVTKDEEDAEALRQEIFEKWERDEAMRYGSNAPVGPLALAKQKLDAEPALLPPTKEGGSLRIAVVLPFRDDGLQDRSKHLEKIIPHIHKIFTRQKSLGNVKSWKILVVEQAEDGRPFNRGALLTAGFHLLEYMGIEFDQVMLHDADLLAKDELTQSWYVADVPPKCLVHLSHKGYKKYQGELEIPGAARGVVVLRREDFKASNGLPLDVWGWAEGLEDRVWADRLGALLVKDFKSPVGNWEDLDEVDMRHSWEARQDSGRYFDMGFIRFHQDVAGPITEEEEKQRIAELITRSGGLDTIQYQVLCKETLHEHATLIRVLPRSSRKIFPHIFQPFVSDFVILGHKATDKVPTKLTNHSLIKELCL